MCNSWGQGLKLPDSEELTCAQLFFPMNLLKSTSTSIT